MQKAESIPKNNKILDHGRKKRIRMKKIGIALTNEMYSDLDNMKVAFYASSVPELIRIILTKFMEDKAKQEKAEKLFTQMPKPAKPTQKK
jgi:hypothetical protein